jgi:hypothetical protein
MRFFATLFFLLFSSCIYEVPLTQSPTRKTDERLVGDWVSVEEKPSVIQIRKFDDSNLILTDGGSVYRVFHSDFEGVSFLSMQNLEIHGSSARKFALIDYRFETPDRVRARAVNKEVVVPEKVRTTPELQGFVHNHLKDPHLFNKEEIIYARRTER